MTGHRVEHAGAPDRRERDLLPLHTGFGGERVRDLADLRDRRALAPDVCAFVAAGDDLAGEVRDGRADEVPAHVEPHDPPGSRVELVQHGRGAPPAARTPRLADQTSGQQRGERLGHRRFRQVAVPGDLRPGDGTHLADELEDRTLVDRLEQARRPRGERLIGRASPSVRKEFGNFPNYSAGCYARPDARVKTSEGPCPRSKTTESSRSSATASPCDLGAVVDALRAGGIRSIEVTADTPGALDEVGRARGEGAPIGAGTIRTLEEARAFADAGARFLVSPGLVPEIVREGLELGVPTIPGVLSPTEIVAAVAAGADFVKLFPASLGGPGYLAALRGPFPDVRFVPTGGIGSRTCPPGWGPGPPASDWGARSSAVRPLGREPTSTGSPPRPGAPSSSRAATRDEPPRRDRPRRGDAFGRDRGGAPGDAPTELVTHGGAESNTMRRARPSRVRRGVGEPARRGRRRRPRAGGAPRLRCRPSLGAPRPRAPNRVDVPRDQRGSAGVRASRFGRERARAFGPGRGARGAGVGGARHRHHGDARRRPTAGGHHAPRTRRGTPRGRHPTCAVGCGVRPRARARPRRSWSGPISLLGGEHELAGAGRRAGRPRARRTLPGAGSPRGGAQARRRRGRRAHITGVGRAPPDAEPRSRPRRRGGRVQRRVPGGATVRGLGRGALRAGRAERRRRSRPRSATRGRWDGRCGSRGGLHDQGCTTATRRASTEGGVQPGRRGRSTGVHGGAGRVRTR